MFPSNNRIRGQLACAVALWLCAHHAGAADDRLQQIGGVIIPQAFSRALQDGMSLPLFIHLADSADHQGDQRIGTAFIWLDDDRLRVRQIQLEEGGSGVELSQATRQQLTQLANPAFNAALHLPLSETASLALQLRQLLLLLVVSREALGTARRARSADIGQSSVNVVSHTFGYHFSGYHHQQHRGGGSAASYLALNGVSALREHHLVFDAALYGIGTPRREQTLYRAMYERDVAGYRVAAGMLDSWNLQSLAPVTALPAGKIFGASWGNQASSTVFDHRQSLTPVVVFLPAAGEVHLVREGRLLSIQQVAMGNQELDTAGLPYGVYDVEVTVWVNGRQVSQHVQRIHKVFGQDRAAGAPLAWQVWGGTLHTVDAPEGGAEGRAAATRGLLGASLSGSWGIAGWAASGYGCDQTAALETRVTLPLDDAIAINLQQMLASDRSRSRFISLSAALPGGFSSLWINQEQNQMGSRLRHSDSDNRALGGTLNLNALTRMLGTLSISYNQDRRYSSHYSTVDYAWTLYSGAFGTLGLRAGMHRYNNAIGTANAGKYIALDLTLPLGKGISVGLTRQNADVLATLSAQRQLADGALRGVGGTLSRALSGGDDNRTLSGGGWAQFASRYGDGTLNVNSGADGDISSNLSASGSIGWQGKQIATSGQSEGNAGIIVQTGLDDDSRLSARINGQIIELQGTRSYLPLPPYAHYDVALQNSQYAVDSYEIISGRQSQFTLYPGNVAVIAPTVRQRITVFGRLHAEDGTTLANVPIASATGRSRSDPNGEFVLDMDKHSPTLTVNDGRHPACAVALPLAQARGAVWLGEVVCRTTPPHRTRPKTGGEHES
ncbi:TcfC E-set like domain-containing protein [Pantoea sp. 1.19]|uniref:TcfC E-set like domain-containing protein n=1 Tax=Pantoea sp. 1.19 TaxID=1925589 RepID=UPI000AA92619